MFKPSFKQLAIGAGLSTVLVSAAMACPMGGPFHGCHFRRVVTLIPEGVHGRLMFKPHRAHPRPHQKLNFKQARIMAQAALIRRGHLNQHLSNGHAATKTKPASYVFTVSNKRKQVLGKVRVDARNGRVEPIIHRPGEWF